MRNENLDKKLPIDEKIGEKQTDENGRQFVMINGRKIYEIEEKTQHDKDMNLIINRFRASGMSMKDYLESYN
jgi:hypothetical protein